MPFNMLYWRAPRFAPNCNLAEKDVNFTPHLSFPYLESDTAAFLRWQKHLSPPAMIAWGTSSTGETFPDVDFRKSAKGIMA